MKNIWTRFTDKYFGGQLDFRARVFNIVAFILLVSFTIGGLITIRIAQGESIAGYPGLICAVLFAVLIWYANKSGNYKICYWIITIVMFMVQAAFAFFLNGGYKNGGVIAVFVVNMAITAFFFEGKKGIIVPLILMVEYAALCIYAYYNPDAIKYFGEREHFLSVFSLVIVTFILICTVVISHLRLHDRQRRELEEARKSAVEYEKMKSEFFAEMSHEMRTPLTIIAVGTQMAALSIKSNEVTGETADDLMSISKEAMRLAGMTDYTLKTLTASFDSSGGNVPAQDERISAPVNVGDLAGIISGIVKPVAVQRGIEVKTVIGKNIPQINGDSGALIRLTLNVLHNAINHSGGKTITITAQDANGGAAIIVEDDGRGVAPELLPTKIFERGVSGGGGTGIGLHVCKTIAQEHGGDISIENKKDGGARVKITLATNCNINNKGKI